jgi:uncharacterized membrane protein
MIMGNFMPSKTIKGVAAMQHGLGLKKYLTVAETARLKFEEAEKRYSKLLPYAMSFKVADKWAERFKGLLKGQPDWYEDNSNKAFDTMMFHRAMSSFSSHATSAMTSSPPSSSSGGGGFSGGSGGGGGGGGVGSW